MCNSFSQKEIIKQELTLEINNLILIRKDNPKGVLIFLIKIYQMYLNKAV